MFTVPWSPRAASVLRTGAESVYRNTATDTNSTNSGTYDILCIDQTADISELSLMRRALHNAHNRLTYGHHTNCVDTRSSYCVISDTETEISVTQLITQCNESNERLTLKISQLKINLIRKLV